MLERGLGYHLVARKNGFIARRNSKGYVPHDGHLRFIFLCAELAQNRLHITDIEVSQDEIMKALHEMNIWDYLWQLSYPDILHADDVLSLKTTFGL